MSGQTTFVDGRWDGRTIREWIPDVVDDVVAVADPVRIIVLGSTARGDAGPDSDLDLLVVVDDLDPSARRSVMGRIRGSITAPIPIDVLVVGTDEYEARRDVNGSPYFWPAGGRGRL